MEDTIDWDAVQWTKNTSWAEVSTANDMFLKRSRRTLRNEYEATRYAKSIGLSVPDVVSLFEKSGMWYLTAERIAGVELTKAQITLTDLELERVATDLWRNVETMRKIPSQHVRCYTNATISSTVVPYDYATERMTCREFNQAWLSAYSAESLLRESKLVESCMNDEYGVCFSHGDLYLCNEMVTPELRVVIVDWDRAGYYPAFWDPMCMCVQPKLTDRLFKAISETFDIDYRMSLAYSMMMPSL
ncbi:hypothetical protein HDU96_008580 [Phlyctochytrium bullatum]|nr:hypothetical protein HDU96_008580 [Phlyctochytrium bullatum]